MNNLYRITFAILLAAASASITAAAAPKASAVDLKGGETPEQIQEAYSKAINALVPDLGKADGQALRALETTLHRAARPDAEPERLACCTAIARALTNAPADAQHWMMKLVAFAGRKEVVPALGKLLDSSDAQIREMARYALQHNPTPEAGLALDNALFKAWGAKKDPDWQIALLLTLGNRKEPEGMMAMSSMLSSTNDSVRQAILESMGMLVRGTSVKPKSGVWKGLPENLQGLGAEAYLKSAERILQDGNAAEAAEMYKEVYQAKLPKLVRMAALVGVLKTTGDAAATNILDLLAGDDKDARAIATGVIPDLGSGALQALAGGMSKLPPDSQILVLGTLADRGEKAAAPVATDFARSKEENVQLAGLAALGRLGDASSVPMLVETMQAGGASGGAAKDSLTKVTGEGVEQRIISAMQSQTDPPKRAALMEVLESRGATAAVPLLLEEAVKDSSTIRRAALRALGKLAQPKDVPAMLNGLLKTAPGSEREEAEKAIASVCSRATEPGKQADAVLALYQTAKPADRLALLPVAGRLGGAKVFEVVKTALASSDPETYQAAIDAISNWPDSDETVETELVTLAQKAEKPADRNAALRAYIRVISTPSGMPAKARLAKFQKAMSLADRDQERILVLERVADIKHIDTLRFVAPSMDNPALMVKACTATLDLARDRGLRSQNKAEFQTAMKKVVDICKDQGLLERANRYLKE